MLDLMKIDDQIYLEEGFRKEHMDRAISHYGLDKEEEDEAVRDLRIGGTAYEEGAATPNRSLNTTATTGLSKSQLILS
jgi:hypothetical protein